jgi:hypothetical protein
LWSPASFTPDRSLADTSIGRQARIAEGVIATVLLAGAAFTWVRPAWTRRAGLFTQAFALLGTLIGIFTIVVGVGTRTAPDVIYHIAIVGVLVLGLLVATRAARPAAR